MVITDEELIKRGFKRYNVCNTSIDCRKYLFQKRYMNDNGDTLYFIDIYKWDWTGFPPNRILDPYTYEITTQLYRKGDHEAINIGFGANMTIEDTETFIDSLFDAGLVEPYEYKEIN